MKSTVRATLAILAFCMISAAGVFAESSDKKEVRFDDYRSALGMFAMAIPNGGAYGLQFEHWFNSFGFTVTGGGYYRPEDDWANILDYSVVFQGMHTVFGNTFSDQVAGRLYSWASIGHHGYMTDDTNDDVYEEGAYKANGVAGLGIGIEMIFFEHFSIPLQFGYTGEFPNDPGLGFTFGSGIRYRY
ncbi:hypothetical protein K7J14_13345 [Treponema zuelzerae]|uniref:Outer membrane protein beta-barrel domain-containing protein n=1 Tax=Teretinema zuelzerae TaxID=156 RepID=A0AAE3JJQ4_9SPIR|nr:hypothetical protein [Teretinema zuelzerae]MCD1655676.1 hypothetical protein [Teretinema zuelzerae]